ncbi:MAG: type II secretion system protein GspM [Candidatus Brocadiia bacterium]
MELSKREKWMLKVGGAVAVLTILIAWGVVPLARRWATLGQRLAPQREALAALREKADRREAMLGTRARLVRRLGTLTAREPEGEGNEGDRKPDQEGGHSGDAPEKPQPGGDVARNEIGPPPDRVQKGGRGEFQAQIERVFQESGAPLKVLSATRASAMGVRLEHFRVVAYQVETETNVESLIKILHAMEKGPRFVRVDRLKVRHPLEQPRAVSVTMEIVAYERADAA